MIQYHWYQMKVSKFKVSRQSVSSTTNINANWLHNSSQHDPLKACSNKHHLGPQCTLKKHQQIETLVLTYSVRFLLDSHMRTFANNFHPTLPMTCSENACKVAEVAAAWYTLVHAACTWLSCTDSEWVNYTKNVKEKIPAYILLHHLYCRIHITTILSV